MMKVGAHQAKVSTSFGLNMHGRAEIKGKVKLNGRGRFSFCEFWGFSRPSVRTNIKLGDETTQATEEKPDRDIALLAVAPGS